MNCPIDGTVLQMTDRQGIEIDYCPKCRGVWLDRGELDKIIERSVGTDRDDDRDDRDDRERRDEYRDERRSYESRGYPKKKRRSMLEDLFDFG